jgi:uroporphyrinogen III methyltransferase/synthase
MSAAGHDEVGAHSPLAGRTILVTRTREQAAALADPLGALGADVVLAPVIAVAEPEDWGPVDEAISNLSVYNWTVFTSANGVERFFERLFSRGVDARAFTGIRVACVGTTTAQALAGYGILADFVPDDFRAEGLVAGFSERGLSEGGRVLIPRALDAREVLPDSLREMGAHVDVVPVYRTVAVRLDDAVVALLRDGAIDTVAFTSGSTARNFLGALDAAGLDVATVMSGLTVASVGPVTTDVVRELGFDVSVQAHEGTMPSLVLAILETAQSPG